MFDFSSRLIEWQKSHGRHDLPWQNTRDPYAVWLSEIMLQQTQVATVTPYFEHFLARFSDLASLAKASQDDVLAHWSGLGYYSRARNLHSAAQIVMQQHGGHFPNDFERLLALPGIGRSTAAAVSVFAFGQRQAILDGNVKRVFTRYFGIAGYPGEKKIEQDLWTRAEQLLPRQGIEIYTQALMDLGATICMRSKPKCLTCPLQTDCIAYAQNRVTELPSPKPRKALPQKETVMLIMLRQGEVLLEKRPPSGIWGGMWSFPETDRGTDSVHICSAHFGVEARLAAPLSCLDHTFTHFKLRIFPQPLHVIGIHTRVNQADHLWLNLDDALSAAIPTPVRKLLRQIK